ncbi:MAG: DUF4214 domain-containing protein [Porticoccaceae bacterium]|nr:DUF4214 domain-containing protein [Porticoccaceae bacterium]
MSDLINGIDIGDAGDFRERASVLSLINNDSASISGSIGLGFDQSDYYRFTAPESGSANFTLRGLSADADLLLYDSAGVEIDYSEELGVRDDSINHYLTGGQVYYIEVDNYASGTNYILDVNLSLPVDITSQVQEIYIGLLGRAADYSGLQYWHNQITSGALTIEQLRANIVSSQPEYSQGLGSMSRTDALGVLYQNLFSRDPDGEGLEYWVRGGGSTVSFDQLVLALVNGASTVDRSLLDTKIEAAETFTNSFDGINYNAEKAAEAVQLVISPSALSLEDLVGYYEIISVDVQYDSGTFISLTDDIAAYMTIATDGGIFQHVTLFGESIDLYGEIIAIENNNVLVYDESLGESYWWGAEYNAPYLTTDIYVDAGGYTETDYWIML